MLENIGFSNLNTLAKPPGYSNVCRRLVAQIGAYRHDYLGLSAGLTNLRPLGPVPLTWISTGSRTSTKWATFAGSV
jgi:hypothetical protein